MEFEKNRSFDKIFTMSPEEKVLLERTLRLSEENNKILKKIQRAARWAFFWGLIKVAVIVTPLVIGYIYLEPFIRQALDNYNQLKDLIDSVLVK